MFPAGDQPAARTVSRCRMTPAQLHAWLDDVEPYWLYLMLRGKVRPGMRLLDAGCGMGRNLLYPLRIGVEGYGVDISEADINHLRQRTDLPDVTPDRFRVESIASLSFPDHFFDAVLCCDVLHFAEDTSHFRRMVAGLYRVLKPNGLCYTRLFTTVGLQAPFPLRAPFQPDGQLLEEVAAAHGALPVDELQTLLTPGKSSQTYWNWQKP